MATHRRELDLKKVTSQARHRFLECLAGRSAPQPIWKLAAPVNESWKFLLPVGGAFLLGIALVGGDAVLTWPWLIGWLVAILPLTMGIAGWITTRRSAARVGRAPGVYLFATDLIEARDGVCSIYNLDGLTALNARVISHGAFPGSEMVFVFGREIVTVPVLGKQTAQLTINKFWPLREASLIATGAGDWNSAAALDPLFEARHAQGWNQICHPPDLAPPLHGTVDPNSGKRLLGMPAAVISWGALAAICLAPLLWFGSNLGREELAFSRAQSRDTVAGWQEYLQRENPRHFLEAKIQYLPRAALRVAKHEGSATALRTFLAKYGDTPAAADAKTALHLQYEKAIEKVRAASAEPVRETAIHLLQWLDQKRTNIVQIRFGFSSAAQMSDLDEFLEALAAERGVSSRIVPIGPSLAPAIWEKREAELIESIQAGFSTILETDLVRFEKGSTFSGPARGFDRPTLAVTCFTEPRPQLLLDADSRKLFLRLAFNTEFDLVVPGSDPYSAPLEVNFGDKIPRAQGRGNLYDGMVASAFEELQQNIATSLFPQHLPERKVRMTDIAPIAPAGSGPMFTATGFCVSADGYIATAHHFTSQARTYKVVTSEGPVEAKLVASDPENDLAILKVARAFPAALALRASDSVKLGESIATIGFPQTQLQGREPKIGKGEIASLAGLRDDPKMFQVSVPIQPGNSGGPLLDLRGNVVGVVVSALTRAQAVNFAVKSNHLMALCQNVPELRNLPSPATDPAPSFEDMIDRVRKATVLIEGYQ